MSLGEINTKHKHEKNAKRNKILYMSIKPTPLKTIETIPSPLDHLSLIII